MKMVRVVLFAFAICVSIASYAKLVPAALFSDRCVLQCNRRIPVWGTADSGSKVSVCFAGQTREVKVDNEGCWRVDLDPLPASCESREMRIVATGTHTEEIVLKDVLVGVVWLCGGQSNMTMAMWPFPSVQRQAGREINGYFDIMLTDAPLVRGVRISCCWSDREKSGNGHGTPAWFSFTPDSSRDAGGFSAAAWHFAMRLHQALKIPIGVIEAGWGGSRIATWIPSEGYAASEHFKELATQPIRTEPTADEIERAEKAGRKPTLHNQPRACWNAMMAPLSPYGIEGAIWYQGCANRNQWQDYYELLTALRTGWSLRFEIPDMPFFLCQITPYGYERDENDQGLVEIREEMERFGRTNGDRVGCAILSDIGEIDCIHPGDKRTVGTRLAALALNRIYGRKELKCDAPAFRKAVLSADGKTVRLYFDNIEKWCMKGQYVPQFELAGTNAVYQIVKSDIKATVPTIDLRVPDGLSPVRVAYMRKSCVHGFVKNEAGLPLGPFRGEVLPSSSGDE